MDVSVAAQVEAALLSEEWDILGSIADRLLRAVRFFSHPPHLHLVSFNHTQKHVNEFMSFGICCVERCRR
jgi:hypothetical protein